MWQLVGRREELAYIDEALADPARAGVVIAGQAGVGKTRLVREATSRLFDRHVEVATATESARLLPFGALSALIPEELGGDRPDVLSIVGRELVRRADGRPIVLAVDDAHLLDPLSSAFVHHAVTTGLTQALITLRSGESAPDGIVALHRDEVMPRLE